MIGFLINGKTVRNFCTTDVFHVQHVKEIEDILESGLVCTYNGLRYDLPMINSALNFKSVKELYEMSFNIVKNDEFYPYWKLEHTKHLEHCDLQKISGGFKGLKEISAYLDIPNIWELPVDPDKALTDEEIKTVVKYNSNDLIMTQKVYENMKGAIEVRKGIKEIDALSLGDATIAEKLIAHKIGQFDRPSVTKRFKYSPPNCVASYNWKSPILQEMYDVAVNTVFSIDKNGSPYIPAKHKLITPFELFGTIYKMGMGGLHSQEKNLSIVGTVDNLDVTSYYPSMMINYKFVPEGIEDEFLEVFSNFYDERNNPVTGAKVTGDKVRSNILKIILNGTYGKLGSSKSKFHSPETMLNVTITGQLLLLILIEQVSLFGCDVISANTDGIEFLSNGLNVNEIVDWWCEMSGLGLEGASYKGLHAKDVNNYIAVYDGKCKVKGSFGSRDVSHSPKFDIVAKAVQKFLFDGTPLHKTIHVNADMFDFFGFAKCGNTATMKNVSVFDPLTDEKYGKFARFYKSIKHDEQALYKDCIGRPPKVKGKWDVKDGVHKLQKIPRTDSCALVLNVDTFDKFDLNLTAYMMDAIDIIRDIAPKHLTKAMESLQYV